jgi:hypothetical protein
MTPEPLEQIRASFDQLLAGTGAYYEQLRRELERPGLDPARQDRIRDALGRATELVEVLESVTFDRVRRLTSRPVP